MTNANDFFSPLENTRPFLKVGLLGFAGSGKSLTSAIVAAGLHKLIGSTKPIAIFDTERSAKFLKPFFAEHGITAILKESRSLADLSTAMKLCEEGLSDILMIDSITHVWEGYISAYTRDVVKRPKLYFDDWGRIKPIWKQRFADTFVQGRFHAIMTGRAGYEYDTTVDDDGKKEISKSGIKMKVEGETAYEPDVLVMMERHEALIDPHKPKSVWREATILKDRSRLIDGKTFRNPTFDDFRPVLDFLLSDPRTAEAQVDSNDAALFDSGQPAPISKVDRTVVLEEIKAEMQRQFPSQTQADRNGRALAMNKHFGSASWTWIEKQAPHASLVDGLIALKAADEAKGFVFREDQYKAMHQDPPEPDVAHMRRRFFALLGECIEAKAAGFSESLKGSSVEASKLRHDLISDLIGEPVGDKVTAEQYEKAIIRMNEMLVVSEATRAPF